MLEEVCLREGATIKFLESVDQFRLALASKAFFKRFIWFAHPTMGIPVEVLQPRLPNTRLKITKHRCPGLYGWTDNTFDNMLCVLAGRDHPYHMLSNILLLDAKHTVQVLPMSLTNEQYDAWRRDAYKQISLRNKRKRESNGLYTQ
jgi:hypothetical protein